MKTKKVIGLYGSIEDVILKLGELKAQGYREEELIAIVNSEEDRLILQERTTVNVCKKSKSESSDGLIQDRIGNTVLLHNSISGIPETEEIIEKTDSSVEQSLSGEVRDGVLEDQQAVKNPQTTPRINTTNL